MALYAFDSGLAAQYGVSEAIFVHRLYFWVQENQKNGRNLRDGRYWTHDSVSALTEVFPFWTRHQIEGIIKRCRDKGLILTAALSPRAYDRTNWYTVTDAVTAAYAGRTVSQTAPCISPQGDTHSRKNRNVYKEQIEDQLEDERARTRAQSDLQADAGTAAEKRPCGMFGNVLLSAGQWADLCRRWPADRVIEQIEALSVYLQATGRQYQDHYAALLRWLGREHPPHEAPACRRLIDAD